MSRRPLSDAEAALWKRVIATVEPLKDKVAASKPQQALRRDGGGPDEGGRAAAAVPSGPQSASAAMLPPTVKPRSTAIKAEDFLRAAPSATSGWGFTPAPAPVVKGNLDGHWDRRMAKGGVQPDITVDLHGHTLVSAYARLDQALARGVAADMRLMLLITGKARAPGSGRGAIRAAVADWLASSRHAGAIVAVRNAHPRHGGDGALYILLRRKRG